MKFNKKLTKLIKGEFSLNYLNSSDIKLKYCYTYNFTIHTLSFECFIDFGEVSSNC